MGTLPVPSSLEAGPNTTKSDEGGLGYANEVQAHNALTKERSSEMAAGCVI